MIFALAVRYLAAWLLVYALIGPVARGEPQDGGARAGLEGLSREMSTCAAYFALLGSVVENSKTPPPNAEIAESIKTTSRLLLTHAMHIAHYIGIGGDVVAERVQQVLQEMLDTIDADPANSMEIMRGKYGGPCDELLHNAARRFVDLLEQRREEF
jgi:hypothetical protein